MPLTGILTSRFGCRKVIIILTLLGVITLPSLTIFSTPFALALTLLFFGAAAGGLDVASTIQSVMIQNSTGRQVMPTMLAFYSIGNIIGSAFVTLLLYSGLSPFITALFSSAIILGILLCCQHNLASKKNQSGQEQKKSNHIIFPKGTVLLIACMCFVVFLVEGAMMDWGALFLVDYKGFDTTFAGIGFVIFSVAIALGRLMGTCMIRFVGGEQRMIMFGSLVSFISFLLTLFIFSEKAVLLGFFLIGFGNANIIPLLFSAAGKQKEMPTTAAISTVSTLGYTGILLGPALIGFIAHFTSLFWAFFQLSVLMLIMIFLSKKLSYHNK